MGNTICYCCSPETRKWPSLYGENDFWYIEDVVQSLKADSHIACGAHAAPMPFTCHALSLRV